MAIPLLALWSVVLIVSLAVLIKSSDYLINSSETIGKYLKLPPFIIGILLVAMGTSLPELASSIFSVFRGATEIVIGNVIGSNIANIFLVLGVASIVARNTNIIHDIIKVELPLVVGSALLLAMTIFDGAFTFLEALLFIGGLLLYLGYSITTQSDPKAIGTERKLKEHYSKSKFKKSSIFVFMISAFAIFLSAKYTIDSVINISGIINIGTEVIAITAIAFGTSLPELVVSLKAVKRDNPEIAVGNVLGSNIFNIFGVMGIAGLFGTISIPQNIMTFGLPLMLIATLMFYFVAQDKRITHWEGWLLVLFYVFFIIEVFTL